MQGRRRFFTAADVERIAAALSLPLKGNPQKAAELLHEGFVSAIIEVDARPPARTERQVFLGAVQERAAQLLATLNMPVDGSPNYEWLQPQPWFDHLTQSGLYPNEPFRFDWNGLPAGKIYEHFNSLALTKMSLLAAAGEQHAQDLAYEREAAREMLRLIPTALRTLEMAARLGSNLAADLPEKPGRRPDEFRQAIWLLLVQTFKLLFKRGLTTRDEFSERSRSSASVRWAQDIVKHAHGVMKQQAAIPLGDGQQIAWSVAALAAVANLADVAPSTFARSLEEARAETNRTASTGMEIG